MSTQELAVIVAPRPVAAAIIDVLTDWSAAGVITTVVVVDEAAVRNDDFRVPAHIIAGGVARAAALQSHLADQVGITRARVAAVGWLRNDVAVADAETASHVLTAVTTTLPQVATVQCQVIGATLQGAQLPANVAWLGWHNIVVAPEDSLAPGSGVERLASDAHQGTLDTHLLTAVVTIAGAWAHANGSPIDDTPPLPGAQVTLFRAFSRLMAAERVEEELVSRLLSFEGGYPLPLLGNERAWAVENEFAAVAGAAQQLLEKHSYVMPNARSVPPRRATTKVGLLKALKMLFGFLWASLRNAPRAWAEAVVRKVSTGIAGAANRAVFGSEDSEYEVVVRGLRADGTPADWSQVDELAANVAARIGPAGNAQQSAADLSGFWEDFVSGRSTLLDGETRVAEIPAVAVGSHRGVIADPAVVVPAAAGLFEPSGAVAANIRGWRVEPADQISACALAGELKRVADDSPMLRAAAVEDRTRLEKWRTERERTYTGQVGFRIGGALAGTREEIADLVRQLEEARRAVELPDDIDRTQRRLASKLRWIMLAAVLGGAVVGALIALSILGVLIGTGVIVGIAVGWLVASLIVFINGQRRLFALIHERQQLQERTELLERHLAAALIDLRRLIRVYRQYVDWTRALGVFTSAPYGRLTAGDTVAVPLGAGLPRCIAFGQVEPQPAVLDEVAARLRNEISKVGWLTSSWQAFLADTPAGLGTRAFEVREQPDALWVDQGSSDRSLLSAWSSAIAERGPSDGSLASLRAQVTDTLERHPLNLVEQLSATIRTRASNGSPAAVTYQQFIAGLRANPNDRHVFDQAVFTHLGAAGQPWIVDGTWVGAGSGRLGGSVVVAQRSRGVSPTDLSITASGATPAQPSGGEKPPPPQPSHPVM